MRIHIITIGIIAAVAAAACGKSEQQKAAEQMAEANKKAAEQIAQGAQQMAQGAQQAAQGGAAGAQGLAAGLQAMARGLQQTGPDGKPVPPADFEKLMALLPDAAGWTRNKPRGEMMTMPFSMSKAEARYTKGDSSINLEITDAAFNSLFFAPMQFMLASGWSERNSEGFKRSMTLNGQPGYEEWTNDTKRGEVTVVVGKRFVVSAHGSSVDSIDALRNFVSQVDLGKLAATK